MAPLSLANTGRRRNEVTIFKLASFSLTLDFRKNIP